MNSIGAQYKHGFHHTGRPSRVVEEIPEPPDFNAPSETDQSTKLILLADDDPGVREVLARVLESDHYRVCLAKTGQEAAAKFASRPADLVLLDLNMPEKDGWAAFRMMDAAHPLVPFIVITARPNQYRLAADLGVDALMEKPLDLPLLLETIASLFSETEAERTRRLTNPNFETVFLKRPAHSHAIGDLS